MASYTRRVTANTTRKLSVSLFSAFLWLGYTSGYAQEDEPDDEPVMEIVTTGTLIKREQSSQLVTTINSDDFESRGATSAIEILEQITTGQPPSLTSNVASAFNPSFSNFANLRSLGPTSTLVLMDGRRIVREPFTGQGVNLNIVPTAMLSAVDVLSDGASSIYGSDAIAGVINFRTFDEVEGFRYYLHSMNPVESGGEQMKAEIALGFGSLAEDGYNIYFGGTIRDREEIRGPDRDFLVEEPRADRGQNPIPRRLEATPGNVRQPSAGIGGDGLNPFPACNPPFQLSDGAGACYTSLLGQNFIVSNGEEQESIIASLTASIDDDHIVSAQYFHSWSNIFNEINPGRANWTIPTNSPYYPGAGIIPAIPGQDLAADVELRNASRAWENRRTNEVDDWANRFLASLEGTVSGLDYEVWGLYSESVNEIGSFLYLDEGTQPAVEGSFDDGSDPGVWINPFTDFEGQTPEAQDWIRSREIGQAKTQRGESSLANFGVNLAGEALQLSHGPVGYALALEYLDEDIMLEDLPVKFAAGQTVNPTERGQRDVWSVTGEVLIPILDNFEVNASLRYDDYSDVGDTTNPKILLSWNTTENVNLHASYNTGFRAPTLFDTFRLPGFGLTAPSPLTADPERCDTSVDPFVPLFPAEDDFFDVCRGQYRTLVGGNKNLKPEESTAFAVGADFQFGLGDGLFTVGVDYWDYELEEVIGSITPVAIFGNLDAFGSFIIRCNDVAPNELEETFTCEEDPGGPNRIGFVEQFLQNLGTTRTSGFDVKASWDTTLRGGSSIGITYNATFVNEYEFQRFAGDGFNDRAGQIVDPNILAVFEYQHFISASWTSDKWRVRLQNRYQSSYDDCNELCGIDEEFWNEVDAYTLFDVSATYVLNESLAATLHVNNVFDEEPPFVNGGRGTALTGSRDIRNTDPRGQSFGITLKGEFR